jgi:L-cysteate sulfo-lyase
MSTYSIADIKSRLGRFKKRGFLHLPTPFGPLPVLSRELDGPALYIKRDDLTGQAFGGNKSRKWEYIIEDALGKGSDTILTWGSLQSNWCLQSAVTARRFGLDPVLVLFKSYDLPEEPDGNLLLDFLLGADVRIRQAQKGKVIDPDQVKSYIENVAAQLRNAGRRPYLAPIGGSAVFGSMDKPLGAISYVEAMVELWEQASAAGVRIDGLVHATGSGGTQAGLAVAARALDPKVRVVGISVSDEKEAFARIVVDVCRETEKALDLPLGLSRDDLIVLDDYLQGGYGAVTPEVSGAVRTLFGREGITLDPVYTAKAFLGLTDLVRRGFFRKGENVVLLHTGGTPALFPFGRALLKNG